MAVVANAGPIERALDRVAAVLTDTSADSVTTAARIVGLWREIFDRAMDDGDSRLALVAAREWIHWRGVLDTAAGLFASRARAPG